MMRALLGPALVYVLTSTSTFASQDKLLISSRNFVCFVTNIDVYSSNVEDGIIIVFLDRCPATQVTADDISNLAVALDPAVSRSAANSAQSVITLSESEFKCVRRSGSSILRVVDVSKPLIDLLDVLRQFCH